MRVAIDPRLLRLFAALALTCALGLTFKIHCLPGWNGFEQYTTGCYSDAVPFWSARGVAAGEVPYLQARLEYPVITGAMIWIEGAATRLFGPYASDIVFLVMVALANAALAGLVLWMLWCAGVDERRLRAWACAPPLILYVGHNWDMGAVAFAVGAMLLARERRLARAAATAGLGVAAKLFPVLLLPLIGLQALFARGQDWPARIRGGAITAAAAILAWGAVNLPIAALAFENWSEFYRFSSERPGTAASVWTLLQFAGWIGASTEAINLWSALLFLAGAAAILALGWQRHRDRLWLLFTPVTAWFLLANKVYSPQFDLWLYPLLLMTAPRLRPVALFVLGDIAAYFAEFWTFAAMEGAWPSATIGDIALAAAVRAAAMLWLIADALRLPPPAWIEEPARVLPSA
ncbi:MAG: hypothetical protein J7483_06860 [Novosphingobium sp.]|nr:hypothetical protein [Novosphingobium sp.]